ncbi:MAG: hypothetical protein KA275_00640 [Chitinophagaceae bacterium]|nr:hypothetical protein [Chitinophagaceae bacterium]
MKLKSDEGLQFYLDNRTKFTHEAIEAAIAEMQKRGHHFTNEELENFQQENKLKQTVKEKEYNNFFGNYWKKNVVKDKNAPLYYSEKAIYIFTILFSVLFGSVILAINFRDSKSKKGIWEVLAFGICYTGLQIWFLSMIQRSNTGLSFLFSTCGAMLLNHFFWKKYIGESTKYRTKPIWIPLIFALLISICFLLLYLHYGII